MHLIALNSSLLLKAKVTPGNGKKEKCRDMRTKTRHNPYNFPSEILMLIILLSCTLRNGNSWPKEMKVLIFTIADLPVFVRSYASYVQNCFKFDDKHGVTSSQTRVSVGRVKLSV
jgi:hypothetical protein